MTELSLAALWGFVTILATYPLLRRTPRAWRWLWGPVIMLAYSAMNELLDHVWRAYDGRHAFFAFFAGCVAASTLLACVIIPRWAARHRPAANSGPATTATPPLS